MTKVGFLPRTSRSTLNILNPLLKVCFIFSIIPLYGFGKKPKSTVALKTYSTCVLILLLSGYLIHAYGKQNDPVFDNIAMTINLIDEFAMLILIITNVAIVAVVCLWRSHRFVTLLDSLERFDNRLNMRTKNGKKRFWLFLVLSQIAIILTLIVDIITWEGYLGMEVYKYYISRNVQWYQFSLAFLLIFCLAMEIKKRLRSINVMLWQSVKGQGKGPMFYTRIGETPKPYMIKVANYEVLRSIKIWYADVGEMVDEMNALFGIVLLSGVLFNITNVVFYTQLVMVYVVFQNDGTFGPFVIVNSLMWIGAALLQTMAIAAACDGLAREADRLPEICYVLLNDIPSVPTTNYDAILKEELLLIAEQSGSRKIGVSAAGFFDVNFGMMGFIVASITSYIIVTIQFVSDE